MISVSGAFRICKEFRIGLRGKKSKICLSDIRLKKPKLRIWSVDSYEKHCISLESDKVVWKKTPVHDIFEWTLVSIFVACVKKFRGALFNTARYVTFLKIHVQYLRLLCCRLNPPFIILVSKTFQSYAWICPANPTVAAPKFLLIACLLPPLGSQGKEQTQCETSCGCAVEIYRSPP